MERCLTARYILHTRMQMVWEDTMAHRDGPHPVTVFVSGATGIDDLPVGFLAGQEKASGKADESMFSIEASVSP
jgi:hypothetical protein